MRRPIVVKPRPVVLPSFCRSNGPRARDNDALSILSVSLRSDAPPVLNVSLSLRLWNLTVIVTGLLLLGVLFGYAFVENFQARPGT
jgi:hypothetical protein